MRGSGGDRLGVVGALDYRGPFLLADPWPRGTTGPASPYGVLRSRRRSAAPYVLPAILAVAPPYVLSRVPGVVNRWDRDPYHIHLRWQITCGWERNAHESRCRGCWRPERVDPHEEMALVG